MFIQFYVDDKQLIFLDQEAVSRQSVITYMRCKFNTVPSKWTQADAVIAVFKSASYGVTKEVILDTDYCCFIPHEVLKYGGVINVKLYADRYMDGAVKSHTVSNTVNVFIKEDTNIPADAPSKYELALALYTKTEADVINLITDIQSKVDSGYFDGNGIESIIKTGTVGLVDTYTIFYTDGTTSVFEVTNGRDGSGGSTDYEELENKPSIEGVTLIGNKNYEEINLINITNSEIEALSL